MIAASPSEPAVERRCGNCGYGIVLAGEPPVCPMCRSTAWQAPDAGLRPGQSGRPA